MSNLRYRKWKTAVILLRKSGLVRMVCIGTRAAWRLKLECYIG